MRRDALPTAGTYAAWKLSPPSFDRCGHLLNAGQDGRTGLKNISGINCIDIIGLDCGNGLPTGSLGDSFRVHRFATPTSEDDLWVCSANRQGINGSIPGTFCLRAKKYILSTNEMDHFADPADTADQWLVPFFEVNPRSRRSIT